MIVYYLGIPGSGKSYSGVNTIYNNFSDAKDAKKDLKKNYINCYTNINEFKFDLVKNVYKFDFDVFLKQITELHQMYSKKKTDEELIEKAKEFKIYKTLFILDECHQYLDLEKKVLVWWLTYHRHLHHDIYLITQKLSLVNAKYKPLAEAFYKAKPMSLTLNKQYFNYIYFTEKGMTNASKVGINKVKKRQAVFKLYQSGDSVESKNVIMKFIIIAAVFFVILMLLGYFFFSSKDSEIENAKPHKISVSKQIVSETKSNNSDPKEKEEKEEKEEIDYENSKLFKLSCTISNCSNDDIEIPPQLLAIFIGDESIKILYENKFPTHLSDYYLTSSNDFYNFIKNKKQDLGGFQDDKQDHSNINLFGSNSSSK